MLYLTCIKLDTCWHILPDIKGARTYNNLLAGYLNGMFSDNIQDPDILALNTFLQ